MRKADENRAEKYIKKHRRAEGYGSKPSKKKYITLHKIKVVASFFNMYNNYNSKKFDFWGIIFYNIFRGVI